MNELMEVIAQIATADSLESLQAAIRTSARSMMRSDGVTLILRDGDMCHYADEDAIAPLLKGRRFPLDECISGWCMRAEAMAVIPDIYLDSRIAHEVYRPTFVRSLVMAPAPQSRPVAAIGAYWAKDHVATSAEQSMLQALANVAGGVLQKFQLYHRLQGGA